MKSSKEGMTVYYGTERENRSAYIVDDDGEVGILPIRDQK
jgi:hypothetical protein